MYEMLNSYPFSFDIFNYNYLYAICNISQLNDLFYWANTVLFNRVVLN